jgi:hypothetical protein
MNKYRFYDSSILITYDGEVKDKQFVNGCDKTNKSIVNLHIIDFTHVQRDEKAKDKPDEGYLFGLLNVIDTLKEINKDILNEFNYGHQ